LISSNPHAFPRYFPPWTAPSASWAFITRTWACATSWSTTRGEPSVLLPHRFYQPLPLCRQGGGRWRPVCSCARLRDPTAAKCVPCCCRLWDEVGEAQAAKNRAAQAGALEGGAPAVHAGRAANRYEAAPGALPEEASRQATGVPVAAITQPNGEQTHAAHPADSAGGCFACQQQPQEQPRQQQGEPRPRVSAERAHFTANGRQLSTGSATEPSWRQHASGGGASCGMVLPKAGFSCNADGSRLPLGPHVEVSCPGRQRKPRPRTFIQPGRSPALLLPQGTDGGSYLWRLSSACAQLLRPSHAPCASPSFLANQHLSHMAAVQNYRLWRGCV
jgi:hypothetical protein